MKKLKIYIGCIFIIIFIWWFFFAHVSINTKAHKLYERCSTNGEYCAEFYSPSKTNLIGLYFGIHDGLYVVLKNRDGKYMGQSSPFSMAWSAAWADIIFPDENERSFSLVISGYEEAYLIYPEKNNCSNYLLKYFY